MSEEMLLYKEKPQKKKITPDRIIFHCPYCGNKVTLKNGTPSCGCYGDFDFWATYQFFRYKVLRFL